MKKPSKHRLGWCNDDWLPYSYAFCPSERVWELAREYGIEGPYPTDNAACTHFLNKRHRQFTTVVTVGEHIKSRREIVGYLVHEASHIFGRMREAMGEQNPSSEFAAYMMQSIVDRLIRAYEATRGPLIGG